MVNEIARKSGIDVRHIEKYADEQFSENLQTYTKAVLDEVYNWVHMNGGLPSHNDYSSLLEHLGAFSATEAIELNNKKKGQAK